MKYLIIIIIILSFIIGLYHTNTVLYDELKTLNRASGRVHLLYSYWYEHYYPNRLLKWYKDMGGTQLILVTCIDRAATPLYAELNSIKIVTPEKPPLFVFVLGAYFYRNIENARVTKLNPTLQWQNIYHIQGVVK